jgi:hypothetical protein
LDLTKLGEGDISAKEMINIDSMEPIDETNIDDNDIVSQVLREGNDKPIDCVVSKLSCPLLATAQAAIRTSRIMLIVRVKKVCCTILNN